MRLITSILIIIVALFTFQTTIAKEKKEKKKKNTVTMMTQDTTPTSADSVKADKNGFKPIKDITKKCTEISGLFNLYQDSTTGKLYIEITEDKLGKEFIYFAQSMNGVIDAGYLKGGYRDEKIFKIEKYFDRLDFIIQNTDYYFDPDNALSKSKNSNINQPLFLSEKILAKTGKTYLIDADNLFFGENITQVKPTFEPTPGSKPFVLGSLNRTKSRYLRIKNFPANTDVAVSYVYDNPAPSNYGKDAVTDARFVTVEIAHSIIAMPENDFQSRKDDPRVGYFMTKITDQTSTSPTPYKDIIHRWDLKKKYPEQALSEPVTPITWWIENTTPTEFRPIIKDAVLAWNKAFEKAGFTNAIVVNEQPDDADWEAEDIRYNVLRWTASPNPAFGGYGPHFANPRTGQILGADIMLEFIYLTNRVIYEKLFDVAGLTDNHSEEYHDTYACEYGQQMHDNILSGLSMLNANGFSDIEQREFMKQALFNLVLHEMGHTFGLNHNFIASQLLSPKEMKDINICTEKGLTSSVMDYTIPNISPDKNKQGLYFDQKPGTYDTWAIQYGYTTYKDTVEEQAGLEELLSQSNQQEHLFFNDGDDMRYPGRGIDPRVMISDMSNDAIAYATENTELMQATIGTLLEKYKGENQSYYPIRNAFTVLTSAMARNFNVVSRYIGGIYIDRSFANQESKNKPYTPVPLQTQKEAMNMLKIYCFGADAFNQESEVYNYLQYQRRGYNREGNEDPKLHERFLNIQKGVLDQLLNKDVLQRIVDTKLYGNQYDINKMLTDLTNAIFLDDLNNPSTIRQNLQGEYIDRLLNIIDEKSGQTYSVKSAVFTQTTQIKKLLATGSSNLTVSAHRQNLLYLINNKIKPK